VTIDTDVVARFRVTGRPRTKGSMKVITPRGRKPIMVEGHQHSAPWRKAVRDAALAADPRLRFATHLPEKLPVVVELMFWFARPETGAGTFLPWPVLNSGVNASGDLDKLVRNVLDALKDARVIADDCLVVQVTASKRWAPDYLEPGVNVTVLRAGGWDGLP
jgi:hypothetical protein